MKKVKVLVIFGLGFLIGMLLYIGNTTITTTHIKIDNKRLPQAFSGLTIAQVSDLHNATFGNENQELVDKITQSHPEIIVVTGDIIDSRRTDLDVAYNFLESATKISPVYYVSGNHEARLSQYNDFQSSLETIGVHVLDNTSIVLTKENASISLVGVEDPLFQHSKSEEDAMNMNLNTALTDVEGFKILLSHRPEHVDLYQEKAIDLVFSGHAHGGQVRLPIIGGMIAPDQGLFPKYTEGTYDKGDTTLVVSRGLGNSLFPLRINNRPELVIVTLENNLNEM